MSFTQLDASARNDSGKILNWIIRNVDCHEGAMPYEWTVRVQSEASKARANPKATLRAMQMARMRGYQFSGIPVASEEVMGDRAPTIRAEQPGERSRNIKHTLAVWDSEYKKAIIRDDVAAQEVAFAAALKLVWAAASAYSSAIKTRNNTNIAVSEAERWNESINEAMERATTLRTHFRLLSSEERRQLRTARTPNAFRNVSNSIAGKATRAASSRRRNRRNRK